MMPTMPTPDRRALVLGSLSIAALALAGCSSGSSKPGPSNSKPVPTDPGLVATWTDWQQLSRKASVSSGTWAAQLAPLHVSQVRTLSEILTKYKVTVPSTPVTTPPGTLATVEIQALAPTALARSAQLDRLTRPIVASVTAMRASAATMLGHSPTLTTTAPEAAVAVALLPSIRAGVYGFEELIAKTPIDSRTDAHRTLNLLDGLRMRLESAAGATAPPQPPDYQLPVAPDSAANRKLLATRLLATMVTAAASQSLQTDTASALSSLVSVWSSVLTEAWRWGVTPVAFPGMTV
jgi:hypothetical protein